MNAGMIGVTGHYYQSTHESLRSAKYIRKWRSNKVVDMLYKLGVLGFKTPGKNERLQGSHLKNYSLRKAAIGDKADGQFLCCP